MLFFLKRLDTMLSVGIAGRVRFQWHRHIQYTGCLNFSQIWNISLPWVVVYKNKYWMGVESGASEKTCWYLKTVKFQITNQELTRNPPRKNKTDFIPPLLCVLCVCVLKCVCLDTVCSPLIITPDQIWAEGSNKLLQWQTVCIIPGVTRHPTLR